MSLAHVSIQASRLDRTMSVSRGAALALIALTMLATHVRAADPQDSSAPPAATAEPTAEAAEMSLAEAEVAVAHARAEKALWTTAFDALQQARASRLRGDVTGTLAWSVKAKELCELSIGQLAYPPEKP